MYLDILPLLLAAGSIGAALAFTYNFCIMAYKRLSYDASNKEVETYADRCYWQVTAGGILVWVGMSLMWGLHLVTFAGSFALWAVAIILTYIASGGRKLFPNHPDKQSG